MILVFLKRKIALIAREQYEIRFTQADIEFLCPVTAREFDRLTDSVSGVPVNDTLGQLGVWLNQESQRKAKEAQRKSKIGN
jgi:hypothetical protein